MTGSFLDNMNCAFCGKSVAVPTYWIAAAGPIKSQGMWMIAFQPDKGDLALCDAECSWKYHER